MASALPKPSVIVPGNYDGVHRGHQALLHSARELGREHGLATVVLTFDPHPATVVAPQHAPSPLTTIARRRELLLRAGADGVIVQRFDREFSQQPPEAFLAGLLAQGARGLVVGPDFRFGRDRAGDLELLGRFAAEHRLQLRVEQPFLLEGLRVSSSAVRQALREGQVGAASELLGHLHDVGAVVIRGDQRGRQLGFPTANLEPEPVLLPADGVYAVVVRVPADGRLRPGVANLGQRPTFDAGRSVEVHLLDGAEDLYDKSLRVAFVERIRGEKRFSGRDALVAQIGLDCARARERLEGFEREAMEKIAWI
ncbi:MAG: bifunctional riboflavin kinase/FAD synthetase [Myxococcales bacterium]|nr:bifunctional riboflavin kinase/FAD synthetase [Myxococcales bacterium]